MKQIKPGSTGRYKITTQGSEHLWDLDAMTWVRTQKDGWNPMPDKDGVVVRIEDVLRWPKVGSGFLVSCTTRPQQIRAEWHQSSTIRSIEKIEEES